MGKLLTGIFMGVFTGALAYEVLKRSNNALAKKCCECIDKIVDSVSDLAGGATGSKENASSKMKSIPVK